MRHRESFSLPEQRHAVLSGCMEGALVILGSGGDLMCGKLLPALWGLHVQGYRPRVLGVDQYGEGADALETLLSNSVARGGLPSAAAEDPEFRGRFECLSGDLREEVVYHEVARRLHDTERCFYCAVPCSLFEPIAGNLTRVGLNREEGGKRSRIVFEKPFGESLDSAAGLFRGLRGFAPHQRVFSEHYLAKGVPRALTAFRQQEQNALLENLLNARHVTRVEVFSDEPGGIGTRGPFFDDCGTLRDMGQHLLQVLALATMELPDMLHDTRRQRQNLLSRIVLDRIESVRGQYEGYQEENGVAANSVTETFFSARVFVANDRWQDVPLVIRSGKFLDRKAAGIVYHFNGKDGIECCEICIQPREKLTFQFAKNVDPALAEGCMQIESSFNDRFASQSPEAYEPILRTALGESMDLFVDEENILASWRILDVVREAWTTFPGVHPLQHYGAGTRASQISNL